MLPGLARAWPRRAPRISGRAMEDLREEVASHMYRFIQYVADCVYIYIHIYLCIYIHTIYTYIYA